MSGWPMCEIQIIHSKQKILQMSSFSRLLTSCPWQSKLFSLGVKIRHFFNFYFCWNFVGFRVISRKKFKLFIKREKRGILQGFKFSKLRVVEKMSPHFSSTFILKIRIPAKYLFHSNLLIAFKGVSILVLKNNSNKRVFSSVHNCFLRTCISIKNFSESATRLKEALFTFLITFFHSLQAQCVSDWTPWMTHSQLHFESEIIVDFRDFSQHFLFL